MEMKTKLRVFRQQRFIAWLWFESIRLTLALGDAVSIRFFELLLYFSGTLPCWFPPAHKENRWKCNFRFKCCRGLSASIDWQERWHTVRCEMPAEMRKKGAQYVLLFLLISLSVARPPKADHESRSAAASIQIWCRLICVRFRPAVQSIAQRMRTFLPVMLNRSLS